METSKKIPCTVEILTHNSATTLEATLQSVQDFDQIIIIDGNSTDETRAIAERFGCEILDQDTASQKKQNTIGDFAAIRNQGIDHARNKWFLFIDSDELFTPELVAEIEAIITCNDVSAAYWIPRKYLLGRIIIERACTYPNQQMRFFHLDAVNKFVKRVHERIEVKVGAQVKKLVHPMLIPVNTNRLERERKRRYYIQIEFDRLPSMSLRAYLQFAFHHMAVSALYFFRTIKNLFIGTGARLPFQYEFDYHLYNALLIKKFIQKIRW